MRFNVDRMEPLITLRMFWMLSSKPNCPYAGGGKTRPTVTVATRTMPTIRCHLLVQRKRIHPQIAAKTIRLIALPSFRPSTGTGLLRTLPRGVPEPPRALSGTARRVHDTIQITAFRGHDRERNGDTCVRAGTSSRSSSRQESAPGESPGSFPPFRREQAQPPRFVPSGVAPDL